MGAGPKEVLVEVEVTALEEGKKGLYFLVVRDIFDKGDERISHGHVMGIGFVNEAHRRLRVDDVI